MLVSPWSSIVRPDAPKEEFERNTLGNYFPIIIPDENLPEMP